MAKSNTKVDECSNQKYDDRKYRSSSKLRESEFSNLSNFEYKK